jgi:hypothetical protein
VVDAFSVLDRRSPLLVLVASVAATVVLVSVIVNRGSSEPLSPSEYRVELREALDGFELLNATGDGAIAELGGKFRSAGERLADVEPPADAARAHARLVAGLRSYGDWLGELAETGRSGAIRFETQLAEHQLAGEDWIEAFNELASKGYLSSPAP